MRVWNREKTHIYANTLKRVHEKKEAKPHTRTYTRTRTYTNTRTYARTHTHALVKTIHFKFPLSINFQNYFSPLQISAYVKSCFKSTWCKKLHQFCLVISESLLFYIFFSTSLVSAPEETLFLPIFLYVNGYWVFPYYLPARKDKSRIQNFVSSVR